MCIPSSVLRSIPLVCVVCPQPFGSQLQGLANSTTFAQGCISSNQDWTTFAWTTIYYARPWEFISGDPVNPSPRYFETKGGVVARYTLLSLEPNGANNLVVKAQCELKARCGRPVRSRTLDTASSARLGRIVSRCPKGGRVEESTNDRCSPAALPLPFADRPSLFPSESPRCFVGNITRKAVIRTKSIGLLSLSNRTYPLHFPDSTTLTRQV